MRTQEEEDAPLLIAGVVDNHGQLIFSRAAGGGNWPFAAFIINKHHPLPSSSSTPLPPLLRAEVTKRFVYYDISINLIRLLEGDLPAVHHPCHHNCEHIHQQLLPRGYHTTTVSSFFYVLVCSCFLTEIITPTIIVFKPLRIFCHFV
ncbi:unnamed protein product [Spirodela intermedia]|uniref:Uncharacterized protein n=1 Tax=Spirodela intermedia TaxID=51605 RepID=A0A7I8LAV1_SPIIN|nr:unnamed protein product [Spirodela intermedia]